LTSLRRSRGGERRADEDTRPFSAPGPRPPPPPRAPNSHEIAASALRPDASPFARGSFGEVVGAVYASRRVAVKVGLLASAEACRGIERDAATLAPLQHPFSLRLYGVARRLEGGGPAGRAALVLHLGRGEVCARHSRPARRTAR